MNTFPYTPSILDSYHFNSYPRRFGSPMQREVNNFQSLHTYISYYDGKLPIFVSHNSYTDKLVLFEQMPWDVDTDKEGTTLEMAFNDLKALADYYSRKEILLTFSGSGFHFYTEFQPAFIPLTEMLNYQMKAYQRQIVEELGLKTVNLSCAESKRLIRIPTTAYVYQGKDGKMVRTDRYAIPINRRVLESYTIKDILELAKTPNPTFIELNISKTKTSIQELVGIKVDVHYQKYDTFNTTIDWSYLSEEQIKYYLSYMMDDKIIHDLWQTHPSHIMRFMACLKMKEFGLPLNSTLQIFDKISLYAHWDNRNLTKQYQQISGIYRK